MKKLFSRLRRRAVPSLGRVLLVVFIVIILLTNYLAFFTPHANAAWFNSSYLYKKAITIDHTKVGLPSVDATTTAITSGGGKTSLSWTHTTGSQNNRLIVVTVQSAGNSAAAGTVLSITYGSTSLTKAGSTQANCNASTNSCDTEIWYAVNPASGSNTVSITTATNYVIDASAMTFYNVNQTTPVGTAAMIAAQNSTNGSSHSVTVNSTSANQLVVDSMSDDDVIVVNAAQTQVSNQCCSLISGASSYRTAASGSTTMSWTNNGGGNGFYAQVAVPINPADLSNFPVLISRTDTDLKSSGNGGLVQNSNGYDIIFTDSTETSKLDHELESYTATTGQIVTWVRIPTLSASTDTVIYLYFDNSSITTSQANPTGVWNSNYKGVWHMDEASGSLNDSTSNANTAAKTGTVTYQVTGQIFKGAGFSGGTGNYFSAPDSSSLDFGTGSFTYSAWIYDASGPSTGNFYDFIYKGGLSNANAGYGAYINDNPSLNGKISDGTTATGNNGANISTGTWYHMVTVVDRSANVLHVYQNGVDQGTVSISSIGSTNTTTNLYFGASNSGTSPLNGRLEEVEISNVALSAGWVVTEYNNQNSPATFYTVGSAILGGNPSIEQQMVITDAFISSAGTGKGIVYIDPAVYSGTVSYFFEFDGQTTSGTGSVTLSYNGGSNTVTISNITTTLQRYRSASFTPSAGEAWISAMSGTGTNGQGRLVIVQTDPTKITGTQSAYDIGDANSVTTTSYQSMDASGGTGKYWKYDSSKFDGTVSIYLEATLASGASGQTATLALFQAGSSCSTPSGGIGAISVTGTSSTRARSADISGSLTSGTTYMVCLKSSQAGTNAIIDNGNILIKQSATGGISKSEIYHTYCSENSHTSSTTLTDSGTGCFNKYDSTHWAGGTFTYFYSGTMKSSSSSDTVTSQLCYKTTSACDTLVSGSSFTTNSTSLAYVTSSSFTPPTGGVELDAGMKVANGADTNTLNSSQLVIDVSSLQTPEDLTPFLPLGVFLPKLVRSIRRRKKKLEVPRK